MSISNSSHSPATRQTTQASDTETKVLTAVAVLTLVLAAGLLVLAGISAHASATDTSESALSGLGYVLAVILAVPALVGSVLASLALARRRRGGGLTQVLAVVGLLAAMMPAWLIGAGFGWW